MTKKELTKTIKEDLREIEDNDKNRPDDESLKYIENMDFCSTDNAVFDYGMKVAYLNVVERMAVTNKEYKGE